MDHLLQKNGLCNKSKSISQTPVDACETWRERGGGGGGEKEKGVRPIVQKASLKKNQSAAKAI